ncbi:MAG: hypothetical protein FWG34_00815 [Oscillospiraceae bacterium]|nr:hypothetical protein [Oscillospiraceae bacterium]
MRKRYYIFICAALAAALILPLMFSCNANDETKTNENSVTSSAGENEKSGESNAENEKTPDDSKMPVELPETDYSGEEFIILTEINANPNARWWIQAVEEQNGEPINDAIYTRNLAVEERFNVAVKQLARDGAGAYARTSVLADEKAYDIAHIRISEAATMARENLLLNFLDMPYIGNDKEWWDQNLKDELMIAGKLYFQTGDITVYDDCRIASMYFNKGMFTGAGLPYPYEAVQNGEWTFDYLAQLTKGLNKDLDGDGQMDQNDQWGFMAQYETAGMMFQASGESVAVKTADGDVSLTMDSPRALDVIEKILNYTTDGVSMFHADTIKASDIWQEASNLFQNDKYFIRASLFEAIPRDLRGMETDFGVLPFPKYNKEQPRYYTQVYSDARVIAFPNTTGDLEKAGIVTEALAYGSVETLTKAFFDISLIQKGIRDVESEEMLKIIFSTKKYDIGFLFFFNTVNPILSDLTKTKSTDFVSKYEKIAPRLQIDLDKLVEDFKNAK